MRNLLILAFTLLPLMGMAQDDLYFTSSKKAKEEALKKQRSTQLSARTQTFVTPSTVDYQSNHRSEDEYNRRYVYVGEYQNAGGAYDSDSLAASIDTLSGNYATSQYDMDDPELDYRYSRRLIRFHTPRLYALASPYYWDLYYGYGAWDYLYDYYDPWYWHYGWSYGWSWGPGWSHPVHYGVSYRRNVTPRQYNSSRGHMAASNRIRTNAMGRTMNNTRTSAMARSGMTTGRTSALGTRTSAQGYRTSAQDARTSTRGRSYTDYTNARTGRSTVSTNEGARTQVNDRTRTSATQRSTTTSRTNVNTYQPQRSYSNQNSSSRTSASQSQSRTSTYTPSTRSSGSIGGGGSFGGGGSSRGGFGGGGSTRGGGGGRR